jgi:hypothetical protein
MEPAFEGRPRFVQPLGLDIQVEKCGGSIVRVPDNTWLSGRCDLFARLPCVHTLGHALESTGKAGAKSAELRLSRNPSPHACAGPTAIDPWGGRNTPPDPWVRDSGAHSDGLIR